MNVSLVHARDKFYVAMLFDLCNNSKIKNGHQTSTIIQYSNRFV